MLRMERGNIRFIPGQCVLLGIPGKGQHREYSIYSAADDPWLEVLVREIPEGSVSRRLRRCQPGERLEIEGPIGYFTLPESVKTGKSLVFVATGTGIAPFHCMVGSIPNLDYTLIHGVRTAEEAYERHAYAANRYILCTSRDDSGNFRGRVTHYLEAHAVSTEAAYYLCGNSSMIDEAYDILVKKGVPADNLHAEVYF
ncbi:MAG: oxidoreductase [Nitrospinaceae bacterium]|nr:oxidoreductase [Nitrospinaceae bacterium]